MNYVVPVLIILSIIMCVFAWWAGKKMKADEDVDGEAFFRGMFAGFTLIQFALFLSMMISQLITAYVKSHTF